MIAATTLVNGFNSTVHNGRNHSITIDLPEDHGGTDLGATPLELAVMSLSGCFATTFAVIAKNSKILYNGMSIEIDADKPDGAKTIEKAHVNVVITSQEKKEKIIRLLNMAKRICPVGILFEKAGVEITMDIVVEA
jgi:uncharacterized OsmC-like protein